jgi:amidase
MPLIGNSLLSRPPRFIQAENTTMNATYFAALAFDYEMGRTQGIDATLKAFNLDALLLPTDGAFARP